MANTWEFNPFTGNLDYSIDPAANHVWTGSHTWTVTASNALLIENAGGTDIFLVDTLTPKIDLLANTNLGASGTGYNFTAHMPTASVGLFWTPNAASSSAKLEYKFPPGNQKHIVYSGTETSSISSQEFISVAPTLTTSGASNIAALFKFTLTDSRTISSGATEAKNIQDFTLNRTSFSSSIQNHITRLNIFTLNDSGTYSRSAGINNSYYGADFGGSLTPTISATSGSGALLFATINDASSIFANNSFTTFTRYGVNIANSYVQLAGTGALVGYRYAPSVTIAGGTSTEAAFYAARSGIDLRADGAAATDSGGYLRMGASADWNRYFESDNEAVENIPTGAVYDWRINAVDQMSLGLRSLTLGDNTANDFLVTINQGNDATLKWDNADQTFYWRTNSGPEFLYPTYQAGVSITTGGVTSPGARYALQTWGIPSAAFGSLGGYWGGVSENDSATGYSGTEVYGGTFYNYFTATNARTITSIWGNFVGNEVNNTSNLTAGTVRGLQIGVLEGTGSMETATDVIALDITKPTVTFAGTAPSNSYYIKIGNGNSFANNNYGIFLGAATPLSFRAGSQSIWSPSANTLRTTANTTHEWYIGANPANGTAGTLYASLTSSLFTVNTKLYTNSELEVDGALNHDGTTVGFYGVAPATRPAAYTQTYSTATRTHANFTSADLSTTAATNIAPWGFATQAQADAIATQFNALRVDVANLKQIVNSMIDDRQADGLAQ